MTGPNILYLYWLIPQSKQNLGPNHHPTKLPNKIQHQRWLLYQFFLSLIFAPQHEQHMSIMRLSNRKRRQRKLGSTSCRARKTCPSETDGAQVIHFPRHRQKSMQEQL